VYWFMSERSDGVFVKQRQKQPNPSTTCVSKPSTGFVLGFFRVVCVRFIDLVALLMRPGGASRSSSGSNLRYFLVRSSRPRSHLRTSTRIFGSGPFAESTRVLYSLNAFKARAELLLDSGINTGHRQAIHTYSAMLRSRPNGLLGVFTPLFSLSSVGLVNVWAGPPLRSQSLSRRVIKSSRSRCRRIASIPPPQADRKCDQAELRGFRKIGS
jgi:hypothetical protein